jgi:hypothetical protein
LRDALGDATGDALSMDTKGERSAVSRSCRPYLSAVHQHTSSPHLYLRSPS